MNPHLGKARLQGNRAARRALRTLLGPESPIRQKLPEPARKKLRGLRRRLPTPVVEALDRSTGRSGPRSPNAARTDDAPVRSTRPEVPDTPVRLWVAPANFAGQGHQWAQSLARHSVGVGARSMAVVGALRFPVDYEVEPETYRSIGWQREQERYLTGYTHVLIEAERPVLGTLYGGTCAGEIDRLRAAGLTVGLISHGSDLRNPARHAAAFRYSPFADPADRTTTILQARAEANAKILSTFEGPVFVSTPDLLDDAPHAQWCPGVVDPDWWASDWPVMAREVPVVVHIPSNGRLKGSEHIDPVMRELEAAGRIRYHRPEGIDREGLRRAYQEADIVVDQLVMGLYGVAAVEAMAAGRVVVAFVGNTVRDRIRTATGLEVPIVEADPDTLKAVIERLLDDRDGAREHAGAGPAYVRTVHDGRYSAQVLSAFTGTPAAEASGTSAAPPQTLPVRPDPPREPVRLFVGPANFAGQGTAWARAAAEHLPGVGARSMGLSNPVFMFEVDYDVPGPGYADSEWMARQERYLTSEYTHVLIEACRPLTGRRYGRQAAGEIPVLRRAGLRVALIAHGSDVRIPDVHTATTRWSPFTDTTWEAVPILQASATLNARTMNEYDGPTFVSTPDLLDFVPGARWCPVVVTPQRWASEHPVLEREVPVVVHAPSASRFKGSELIDPLLSELAAAGRIDYRRVTGVPPAQMPQIYGDADIVLDQFVLGSYGVAACEAMAAGRVVVGHVTDAVRARVRADSGVALPIVEADPDSIVAVIDGLLADRDAARAMAGAGVEFVGRLHDGAWSAKILGESFLTLP
ncbi:MAG: glycosyltransferase [Austwickia sp.]|nr:glycosyltransferase [Austwickia sp.]